MPSAQYKKYEAEAIRQLEGMTKLEGRFNVRCVYYMPTRRRVDLVNLIEATCDILVRAGILEDDKSDIVAGHDGSRVLYDKEDPRAEITIEEMKTNNDDV